MRQQRCQNDYCEHSAGCSIRRKDLAAQRTAEPVTPKRPDTITSPVSRREPWKEPVQFSVRPSRFGWLGVLTIQGRLGKDLAATLSGLGVDLFEMQGLFLKFDTLGGFCGPNLHGLVLLARLTMPVVGWVQRSCFSAGVLPLAACNASFCHSSARVGCFGVVRSVCDGLRPAILVSSQSPKKVKAGGVFPVDDPSFISNGNAAKIQGELDQAYERDFEQILEYTGANPIRLRRLLDGRILTPRQAQRSGLVDGLCPEEQAYQKLLQLVEKHKQGDSNNE